MSNHAEPPETIDLGAESQDIDVNTHIALEELELRKKTVKDVVDLFKKANFWVLAVTVGAVIADYVFIGTGLIEEENRLISEKVVMTLIGATTLQVGAIMISISTYLFPKKNG